MATFSLSDTALFNVVAGSRITGANIRENPGNIPVYSCFKNDRIIKGWIDQSWLLKNNKPLQMKPCVTVNANGASVGKVFVREPVIAVDSTLVPLSTSPTDQDVESEEVRHRDVMAVGAITDDVIVVEVLSDLIDPNFLAVQLRSSVAAGGFLYEAKLFVGRVKKLEVDLPVNDDGTINTDQQKIIASAVKRFDNIRQKLAELGQYSENARIA